MPPFVLPRLPAPTASRLSLYTAGSVSLAALVLLRALGARTTAFAALVAVSKSNGSLMVLGNLAVCGSLLLGIALQRVFLGRLRPIEVEHLYEKAWYFLTESLLAFTMFRQDFGFGFLTTFGILLGLKCFHWLAADRIDYLDQLASPPRWTFHARLLSLLLGFLAPLDLLFLSLTARKLYTHGMGGRVLFVSEFAVLAVSLAGVGGRYAVWAWDAWRTKRLAEARRVARERRRAEERAQQGAVADGVGEADEGVDDEDDDEAAEEDVWEGKSMVLFYLDLTTDFLKLLVYLLFFVLVLAHYGLPFNILRDLYLTSRSFLVRLRTLVQYRRATSDMEARYADADEADVRDQSVCIICRDALAVGAEGGRRAKRLGCGHAFHLRCLRMWLERQQSCPTCRRTVLGNTPAAPAAAPVAPPAPAATAFPPPPTGAAASHRPPPAGQLDRPLPPNLVAFGDRLAQRPPAPLDVRQLEPYPSGGIFGAPNPPARFAYLFEDMQAPPQPSSSTSSSGASAAGDIPSAAEAETSSVTASAPMTEQSPRPPMAPSAPTPRPTPTTLPSPATPSTGTTAPTRTDGPLPSVSSSGPLFTSTPDLWPRSAPSPPPERGEE